tara:strand:+ start:103 stop:270 length:168 start_codon:yes stop_codon:yes gene_type:complete
MAERYKGVNVSDMKKYIMQTQGKAISVEQIKKMIDEKFKKRGRSKAKGGIVKKKK